MNRFLKAILILGLISSLYSCDIQKKIIKEPLKEEGSDILYQRMKENEFKFDWLDAKFSATFSMDGKDTELKGVLRIKKDSAMWVSISPALGIEMARLLLTQDSVMLINRLNSTYLKAELTYINDLLETNFDFDILQALLIGNDLSCYDNEQFKASIADKNYHLSTLGRRKIKKLQTASDKERLLLQDIWLNSGTYKIEKTILRDVKTSGKLEAVYSGFVAHENQIMPTIIYFNFHNKRANKLIVEINKTEINKPKNISFSIPSNYKPIEE